jgi:hypothetical protein
MSTTAEAGSGPGPAPAGGTGLAEVLCRGLTFDRTGELVASVMQEGLIRRLGEGP